MAWDTEILNTHPPGVAETESLLSGMDLCLARGFSRLSGSEHKTLQSLERIFSRTAAAEAVEETLAALLRAEFREEHFTQWAVLRSALQGAQYDALLTHAAQAFDRAVKAPSEDEGAQKPPEPDTEVIQTLQSSARHWLMELALSGFAQLEQQHLAPFSATLEPMHAQPTLVRLSVLLTGLLHELSSALPFDALPMFPQRRWADLWTRGMVSTLGLGSTEHWKPLQSATLSLLGVQMRQHAFFASPVFYGILDANGESTFVQLTYSAYKVDVITDIEVWDLFGAEVQLIRQALDKERQVALSNCLLGPGGQLVCRGEVTIGESSRCDEVAEGHFGAEAELVPPLWRLSAEDRHPARIELPVYLSELELNTDIDPEEPPDEQTPKLEANGHGFTLDFHRNHPNAEFSADDFSSAKSAFGLLHFDNRQWAFQPLWVASKRGKIKHAFPAPASKSKNATVSTLKERASKLLRS